jgi:hypothetical protein
MSYTTLDGLPIPRRPGRGQKSREIVVLAARLTCTSEDMLPFWDQLSADGWVPARSLTEVPGLVAEDARLEARSRLDALVAVHLYGLETADMEIILEDFKALSNREHRQFGEFRTRRLVLAEMDLELSDRREKKDESTGERPALPDPGAGSPPHFGSQPELSAPRDAADADSIWASPSGDGPTGGWRAETTVHPNKLVLGQRVRHRAHGEGTVLTVKPSGKGAELLVRFDVDGEKWIVFGYGVLEFAHDEGAPGERGHVT